jgi:hypothetical protein
VAGHALTVGVRQTMNTELLSRGFVGGVFLVEIGGAFHAVTG